MPAEVKGSPRTDAIDSNGEERGLEYWQRYTILIDHARQLEREHAELVEALEIIADGRWAKDGAKDVRQFARAALIKAKAHAK